MSHSDSGPLPAPRIRTNSLAGSVQTCSVYDQHDYYRLIRDTSNSYQVSLTIYPTPLYLVEMPQSKKPLSQKPFSGESENEKPQSETARNTAAFETILLFDALDSKTPMATCCMVTKSTNGSSLFSWGGPVATMCPYPEAQYQLSEVTTSSPWIPIFKMGFLSFSDYTFDLPVVMVPGCRPIMRPFGWNCKPGFLELRMTDERTEDIDRPENAFAVWHHKKGGCFEKGVLEIRRGGGLPFELGVVISALAVNEMLGH